MMKSKKYILFLLIALFTGQVFAVKKEEKVPRPKLVVGIVVDQMRWDYLYRYYERYGDDGFKRLLKDGFSFENTYINHLPTVTGIGHATVFTGSVPAIHGITGNSFTFNSTGESTNCVGDDSYQTVGNNSTTGQRSPTHLLVTTIGDELKLATNFRAKVIGVSLKDRASILPAGHSADAAYWYDTKSGEFVTSTYYMDELPKWVSDFNKEGRAKKYMDQDWHTLYDIDTYIQSTEDDKPYEGTLKGQESPTFPVKLSELYTEDDLSNLYSTPYGNSITLDLAKAAVVEEKMGQGEETDMLTINLASTDAVGHRVGVNSIEVEDTYLRLDKELGDFFKHLDSQVGEGNYTVFLTADHGGAHNRYFLEENKIPTHILKSPLKKDLNELLNEKFGVDKIVRSTSYMQVYFDYKIINEHNLDEQEIRDACMAYLLRNPEILFAVDMHNVGNASIPKEIKERIVNGHHPDRSGAIQFILNPNSSSTKKGTSHSHWNPYDAKIPNIWMGWGIKKGGHSVKQAHMEDIAPTISNLLRITPPNGNIGKSLGEEVFEGVDL